MPQRPAMAPERPSSTSERFPAERSTSVELPSSVAIAVQSLDHTFCFYVQEGHLQRMKEHENEWTVLSPEDILQHLVLRTPVAVWLADRIILKPADWVKPYLQIA